jgi:hypothetical protein
LIAARRIWHAGGRSGQTDIGQKAIGKKEDKQSVDATLAWQTRGRETSTGKEVRKSHAIRRYAKTHRSEDEGGEKKNRGTCGGVAIDGKDSRPETIDAWLRRNDGSRRGRGGSRGDHQAASLVIGRTGRHYTA